MEFVITAGHSNTDPGAVAADGSTEAKMVLEFRDLVVAGLKQAGATVYADGNPGDNQPLTTAIALAKARPKVPAIEFHMNASANVSATGVESISHPPRKQLAQRLSQTIAGATGQRLRGDVGWIDPTASARGRLGFCDAGGVIVELVFLSNPGDLARWKATQRNVAAAVVSMLITYAGD